MAEKKDGKYTVFVRVGYIIKADTLSFLFKNKHKKDTFSLDGISFDDLGSLVQTMADRIECQFDFFGDMNDESQLYVGFVLPNQAEYAVNSTMHFGRAVIGPDLSVKYLLNQQDKLKAMADKMKDIGLPDINPTIYLSWIVDDKGARVLHR